VLINQLGAFVQTFLLLYLVYRGFSIGAAGMCLVAYSVGSIFGTLLGGELTHRFGARATISSVMAVSGPLVAALPWVSGTGMLGLVLADAALAGLVTQAYRPASAVLLSDLMPEKFQVMAFSMMRIALNIGAALGPLLAAVLITVNWDLLFWFDGATAIVYAALAFALLPKAIGQGAEEPAEEESANRRSAYAVLVRDTRFLCYLGSIFIGTIVYVQFFVALPLEIVADGHSTALYSAVLTTSSLVLISCELKITSYVTRWNPRLAVGLGHVVFALGVGGWGLASGSSALVIISTVLFVSGLMMSGPSMFAFPAKAPSPVKARYVGTAHAVIGLSSALGPAIGVFAWTQLGNGLWAMGALLGVVAGVLAWVAFTPKPAPATEPVLTPEVVGENV
jgi:MFS family permease